MALQRQSISIPISQGVDTKTDPFQVEIGKALVLENARFQKVGKLSKRFGLVSLTTSSNDGLFVSASKNSLITDDQYLGALTNNGVYAYSQGDDKWYKQSSFALRAKVETSFVSKNQLNQRWPDFDVTPDGTHRVYACVQNSQTATLNSSILVILEDVSTGLRKSASIYLSSTSKVNGPRCIVVKDNGNIYVHVFYFDGTEVKRSILNESLEFLSYGVTIIPISGLQAQFDICKDDTRIYFAHIIINSLNLRSYDYTGVQQATNTVTTVNSISISASSANGMCLIQTASNLHLSFCAGNAAFIGFTKNLIPAITETTSSGGNKVSMCASGSTLHVVVDSERTDLETSYVTYYTATFTTTYSFSFVSSNDRIIFSAQPFIVNSKAFCVVRSNELENKNYYLFNLSDKYIAQRFSPNIATSQSVNGVNCDAMVSKTVVLSGVAYCSINRVSIITGSDAIDTISAMSLLQLNFNTTKEDGAKFKIGNTLYHLSGSLVDIDKLAVYENSFLQTCKIASVTQVSVGTANPNIASKTFSYIAMYEFYNAQGERVFSAPSLAKTITTTASAVSISIFVYSPTRSLKNNLSATNFNGIVSITLYRTLNGGTVYYRNQSFVTNNNDGTITVLSDTASDSSIQDGEVLYTTGDILQNDPPPAAKFGTAGGNRIFLGGLEDRDEIAFSKKQLFGETVLFSDFYRLRVSSGTNADKTPISALGYMDGKIVIFRQQSIYFSQGDGPNETGVGAFTDPEVIQSDVGCTDPRSVLSMPDGLMFKSRKGIYLLSRGLSVEYVGAPVEEYNSENIVASILSEKFNECRFYTDQGKCLSFNYLFRTWSVFTGQTNVDAANWQGAPIIIKNSLIQKESEVIYTDNNSYYAMKYTSPWIKFDLIQGYMRTYQLWILGTYKSAHTLKCRIYWDYNDATYEDYSLIYNSSDSPQYQFQISLPVQKVESIKFEIYDSNQSGTGESFDLSNIQLEVGIKSGGYKLAASKSY